MHNGAKYTAEALETVITSLQEQGYTLVPISQLIVKREFLIWTVQADKLQIKYVLIFI